MRSIGSIPVPLAGVGCNNFGRRIDESRAKEVVDAAFEVGATLFDTADLYGSGASEEFLGKALRSRRDEAVIVSKFGMRTPPDGLSGGDPVWAVRACEDSLTRLATDRIDVYLIHTPDDSTPIADTLTAMSHLVDEGKVREIGCSNFSAEQLEEAEEAAKEKGVRRFVTVQNEYSLLAREAREEVLPACRKLGLSFMPYFPLASGLLTGKYRKGQPPPPGTRLAGRWGRAHERRAARCRRALDGVHRAAWPHDPRARDVLAGVAAGDRHRDRRRDERRAGPGERRGGRGLAAQRGRVRRDR